MSAWECLKCGAVNATDLDACAACRSQRVSFEQLPPAFQAMLLLPVAGLPLWVLATATDDDVEFVWLMYAALGFLLTTTFSKATGWNSVRDRLTFALALSALGFFIYFFGSSLLNGAWRGNAFVMLDRAVGRLVGDVAGFLRVALELWMVGGIAYGVSRLATRSKGDRI